MQQTMTMHKKTGTVPRQKDARKKGACTTQQGYRPLLDAMTTQEAMSFAKASFEKELSSALKLTTIMAPRFLETGTGLQDDLAGTQVAVSFMTKATGRPVEIVHSLAKWKRATLGRLDIPPGHGILTDMHAVRKDEDPDDIHSIHVDQWDWEAAMRPEERGIPFLKEKVRKIYAAVLRTEAALAKAYPALLPTLPQEISFVHAEELEDAFPRMSPREREDEIAKKKGAVFIIGIGHPLGSGTPHDLRAADYDDWSTPTGKGTRGLNGDIIVWDTVRRKALELSSMGIRVDKDALLRQLKMAGLSSRTSLPFHKGIIDGTVPLSIGGGIGQSRLAMLLLKKAHIAEVQASVWPEAVVSAHAKAGVTLL